eukprot:scaffold107527_cov69-Phaeocystis_antarctica.AAC.2
MLSTLASGAGAGAGAGAGSGAGAAATCACACACTCTCTCACTQVCTHRLAEEVLQVHPRRAGAQVAHVQLAPRAACGLAILSHEDLAPVELRVVQLGDRA